MSKRWMGRATMAVAIAAGAVGGVAPVGAAAPMTVAYAFDQAGTTVADASGQGRVATATATQMTVGRHGSALVFDGTRSTVVSNQPVPLGPSFTVMAWVSNPAAGSYETIASVGSTRDVFLAGSTLSFFDGTRDLSFGPVPTGRWSHVAVTSDGSRVRAYVDGQQAGADVTAALGSTSAALHVGAWPSGGGLFDYFSGVIDEVRVYPRGLSAAEIATDAAQPLGTQSPPPTTTTPGTTTPTTAATTTTTTTTAPATTLPPPTTTTTAPAGAGSSLRFFGNGRGGIDRVRIPLTPDKAVNVAGNFTLEWWMKAAGPLVGASCSQYNDAWIRGNILLDRDVYGAGDRGDYGISVFGQGGGRIAFGVSRGGTGTTLCSTIGVADGAWHHVAVTRSTATGTMAIFIDGQPRGTAVGPTGDISYRQGRSTGFTNDPYLVIGAEKHDAGSEFPSYPGWLDELRVSTTVRYTAAFQPPRTKLVVDSSTAALYRFDEGTGTVARDASGGDDGTLLVGGSPAGPVWTADRPF